MERHELVDHLEQSKSTVYKGITQLQERGLVASTARGLRPTLYGVVALERYDELAGTAELGELLADLPPETVDPAALVGAEAVLPDRQSVDRHLARLERLFEEARSLRGFSTALSPEQSTIFRDRSVADDLAAEWVLPAGLLGHLYEVDPQGLEATVSAADVTLYRTERDPPFSLCLADLAEGPEVCIALGEEGVVTGLLLNDTAASRRWAESEFERTKRSAERVTPADLPPAN